MKLSAYVTQSRHGIFYFRWPVPLVENRTQRATVRLSLRTRCPKRAGRIARYLASSTQSLWPAGIPTQMRQDELRAHILAFFKAHLAKYIDRIGANGPLSEFEREAIRTTQRRPLTITGTLRIRMALTPSLGGIVTTAGYLRPKPTPGLNECSAKYKWPIAICFEP
jgi:hypothetical protein